MISVNEINPSLIVISSVVGFSVSIHFNFGDKKSIDFPFTTSTVTKSLPPKDSLIPGMDLNIIYLSLS